MLELDLVRIRISERGVRAQDGYVERWSQENMISHGNKVKQRVSDYLAFTRSLI